MSVTKRNSAQNVTGISSLSDDLFVLSGSQNTTELELSDTKDKNTQFMVKTSVLSDSTKFFRPIRASFESDSSMKNYSTPLVKNQNLKSNFNLNTSIIPKESLDFITAIPDSEQSDVSILENSLEDSGKIKTGKSAVVYSAKKKLLKSWLNNVSLNHTLKPNTKVIDEADVERMKCTSNTVINFQSQNMEQLGTSKITEPPRTGNHSDKFNLISEKSSDKAEGVIHYKLRGRKRKGKENKNPVGVSELIPKLLGTPKFIEEKHFKNISDGRTGSSVKSVPRKRIKKREKEIDVSFGKDDALSQLMDSVMTLNMSTDEDSFPKSLSSRKAKANNKKSDNSECLPADKSINPDNLFTPRRKLFFRNPLNDSFDDNALEKQESTDSVNFTPKIKSRLKGLGALLSDTPLYEKGNMLDGKKKIVKSNNNSGTRKTIYNNHNAACEIKDKLDEVYMTNGLVVNKPKENIEPTEITAVADVYVSSSSGDSNHSGSSESAYLKDSNLSTEEPVSRKSSSMLLSSSFTLPKKSKEIFNPELYSVSDGAKQSSNLVENMLLGNSCENKTKQTDFLTSQSNEVNLNVSFCDEKHSNISLNSSDNSFKFVTRRKKNNNKICDSSDEDSDKISDHESSEWHRNERVTNSSSSNNKSDNGLVHVSFDENATEVNSFKEISFRKTNEHSNNSIDVVPTIHSTLDEIEYNDGNNNSFENGLATYYENPHLGNQEQEKKLDNSYHSQTDMSQRISKVSLDLMMADQYNIKSEINSPKNENNNFDLKNRSMHSSESTICDGASKSRHNVCESDDESNISSPGKLNVNNSPKQPCNDSIIDLCDDSFSNIIRSKTPRKKNYLNISGEDEIQSVIEIEINDDWKRPSVPPRKKVNEKYDTTSLIYKRHDESSSSDVEIIEYGLNDEVLSSETSDEEKAKEPWADLATYLQSNIPATALDQSFAQGQKRKVYDVPIPGHSDNPEHTSFILSLNDAVPLEMCHPEALKYRDSFSQFKDILIDLLVKLFNQEIFDNKMPPIEIKWSGRLTTTSGITKSSSRITAAGKVRTSGIKLSKTIVDNAGKLRDVLLHEMCHAANWLIDQQAAGHGPLFKKWVDKAQIRFPEIPRVSVCHRYELNWRYIYRCTWCGYEFGKMKLSLKDYMCKLCDGSMVVVSS